MNFRLCTGLAAIVCMSLASCYPYHEGPQQKKKITRAPEKTVSAADQAKLKEQEAKKKAADELKKKEAEATTQVTPPTGNPTGPTTTTPPTEAPKPPVEKRDFAFANKVPGKEGFVFSPYNNKVVDVRDIPSGTLVQDPTYPAAEKKYFRVP